MVLSKDTWQLYRDSAEGQAAIKRTVLEHAAMSSATFDDAPFDRGLLMARPIGDGEIDFVGLMGVDLQERIGARADLGPIGSHDEADAAFTSIVDDGLKWNDSDHDGEYVLFYAGGEQFDDGYEQVISSIDGLTAGTRSPLAPRG